MKKKTKPAIATPAVALPCCDISDAAIVAAIVKHSGFPSKVADALGMSVPDLLARAKASREVSGAFIDARQRQVDLMKAFAMKLAIGDDEKHIPPDPVMLRWFIDKYE